MEELIPPIWCNLFWCLTLSTVMLYCAEGQALLIENTPWDTIELTVVDPFSNRITFYEEIG